MGAARPLRHRAAARRRRVHLRRRDGAVQFDRGLSRRAAQQAALSGRVRPLRQADRRQQRRDARQRSRHRARRRGCVRRHGHEQSTARNSSASRDVRCGPASTKCRSGMTLKALIARAGGVRDGRSLQAVLLGGAAGVFVTPDGLDFPLTLEGARAAGATLGSGVVMLFDDTRGPARHRPADRRLLPSTSRAVSACPAGSAPCGRRRRCIGSRRRPESREHDSPSSTTSHRRCATRRSAGSGRRHPAAVQSAIRKLRVFG